MRRRLLGLIAVPFVLAQCAPTQCSPVPPAPAPTTVETTTTSTSSTTTTTVSDPCTTTTTLPAPALYAFLAADCTGQYTRWSGCEAPITWQLDVTVVPTQGFRDAVAAALATVSATTGHTFRQVADLPPNATPVAEAVIGLRTFESQGTLGQGGGRFTSSYKMVSGSAYVAARLDGAAQAELLRTTLLHEIGHMVGLGHADDREQVMYRVVRNPPKQEYQGGDREGLFRVGTQQPCLATMTATDDADEDEPTTEIIITD